MVELLRRMQAIDRRVLYLIMAGMVLIPVISPFALPFYVSEPARRFYEAIEAVPEGKIILVATDFDTATRGENEPQVRAVVEHLLRCRKPFAIFGLEQQGPEMGEAATEEIAEVLAKEIEEELKDLPERPLTEKEAKQKAKEVAERVNQNIEKDLAVELSKPARDKPKKIAQRLKPKYGTHWCNFGYQTAAFAFLTALGKDVPGTVKRDMKGTPVSQIEVMRDIKDHKDIGFIAEFTGAGWLYSYLQTIQGIYRIPMGQGCTGIIGPEGFPFLDSGQLKGILIGMKGAAEYETLVRTRGKTVLPLSEYRKLLSTPQGWKGLKAMPAQSMGHLVILLAILLGNLGMYLVRKRRT